MNITAKIIADSRALSSSGKRVVSMEICFPRYILAEFNTHRVFSRNFRSSRAVPVKKLLEEVRNNPVEPIQWQKNIPGMQGGELMTQEEIELARDAWRAGARYAADQAEHLATLGLHKQWANRVIEPYLYVHGLVTSTEWDNFFELRLHEDAQPEIHELAQQMKIAMDHSTPIVLDYGDWHLPYVTDQEKMEISVWKELGQPVSDNFIALRYDDLIKISIARAARVSYTTHDGKTPDKEKDFALYNRLVGSRPIHASPSEHCCRPLTEGEEHLQGNFNGFVQFRKLLEKQFK